MALDEVGKNGLNIWRIRANYLLSSDSPHSERTKDRLDAALERDLGNTLTDYLGQWFSESDSSIWFIRSLEFETSVNASWEREHIANAVARQITGEVRSTLAGGPDGERVVRFPDRAAYLARFLVEALDGSAWKKWYFESFKGLKLLPPAAAFRTAVCEDVDTGLAALLQLPKPQIREMIRSLNSDEIRRILETFVMDHASGSESDYFQAVWEMIDESNLNLFRREHEWQNAIQIYLQLCRDDSGHSSSSLLTAVTSLLRLAICLGELTINQGNELLDAFINNSVPELYKRTNTADAEALLPLMRQSSAWIKSIGDELVAKKRGKKTGDASAEEKVYTRFGGIFLLLPILDELPLEEAVASWPQPENMSTANLIRFLLLVKCCGGSNINQLYFDPVVRDLLIIDPALDSEMITAWQHQIKADDLRKLLQAVDQIYALPQQMQEEELSRLSLPGEFGLTGEVDIALTRIALALLGSFTRRLPGFAASSIPFVYHNFLDFPASVEKKPDRLVVRLGSPPLRLVLNLTGMMRRSYQLDWLDSRPIELFEGVE